MKKVLHKDRFGNVKQEIRVSCLQLQTIKFVFLFVNFTHQNQIYLSNKIGSAFDIHKQKR